MAHRSMILAATYLVADVACALSVNGAALLALRGPLWDYVTAVQLF